MPKIFASLIIMCCLLQSCSNGSRNVDLTIACASSAQFAVRELADAFSENRSKKIEVITGSSGKLTTQLINGAPFDIFFSANMSYPELLFTKSLTIDKAKVYAKGVPVFWTRNENYDLSKIGSLLQMDKINKIAIADPKNAPYGAKAVQHFKDLNRYALLQSKFVYGESIAQVNEFILSENAAIGVTAKSIISSPKLRGVGKYLEFGTEYWISQGVVAIKNEREEKLKMEFLDFVHSNMGKKILKRYGFAL